mmetsp:Transcript_64556/g.199795  ORF Transcript_64556/g.199795 Transcript_64556/m.199795 type:complete len:315 (+) Transcript_64556:589-1533(+)
MARRRPPLPPGAAAAPWAVAALLGATPPKRAVAVLLSAEVLLAQAAPLPLPPVLPQVTAPPGHAARPPGAAAVAAASALAPAVQRPAGDHLWWEGLQRTPSLLQPLATQPAPSSPSAGTSIPAGCAQSCQCLGVRATCQTAPSSPSEEISRRTSASERARFPARTAAPLWRPARPCPPPWHRWHGGARKGRCPWAMKHNLTITLTHGTAQASANNPEGSAPGRRVSWTLAARSSPAPFATCTARSRRASQLLALVAPAAAPTPWSPPEAVRRRAAAVLWWALTEVEGWTAPAAPRRRRRLAGNHSATDRAPRCG